MVDKVKYIDVVIENIIITVVSSSVKGHGIDEFIDNVDALATKSAAAIIMTAGVTQDEVMERLESADSNLKDDPLYKMVIMFVPYFFEAMESINTD